VDRDGGAAVGEARERTRSLERRLATSSRDLSLAPPHAGIFRALLAPSW
jgi:hypothetical protein